MEVIRARNVNDAYAQGLALLRARGFREASRAGEVLVMPCPVTTVYERPQERVLLDPARDANPFFHLFEALHMLAGRRDARWLDRFVRDFSSRFAEDDGEQHGAYGYRWRRHFDVEGGGHPGLPDQLDEAVRLLRADPHDRRVVLAMWDPVADLGAARRDVPCNTHVYLRVREEAWEYSEEAQRTSGVQGGGRSVLDQTVCCRSNDAIWGAYGANAVHFSVLQEYLAGRIDVDVGLYYQISNNFHAYVGMLDRVGEPWARVNYYAAARDPVVTRSMGQDWGHWDDDLERFMAWTEGEEPDQEPQEYPRNPWFHQTAEPLFVAHGLWRRGERSHALEIVSDDVHDIAPDWRLAARRWFERRMDRR